MCDWSYPPIDTTVLSLNMPAHQPPRDVPHLPNEPPYFGLDDWQLDSDSQISTAVVSNQTDNRRAAARPGNRRAVVQPNNRRAAAQSSNRRAAARSSSRREATQPSHRRGKRIGPLTALQRDGAREVRDAGACLRCRMYKSRVWSSA